MADERSVGELLDELFGFESVAKRQAALEQYDRGELVRKARSRELLGVLRASRLPSTPCATLPCGLLTGMFAVLRALLLRALASRRVLLVRCGWSVAMLPFCAWRTRPSCWPVWSRRLRLSR